MTASKSCVWLTGVAIALAVAPALAADPASGSVLGFSRPQVADITVCGGETSFAMAAFVQYQGGQSREQARKSIAEQGHDSTPALLAEIDRVYDAKPKLARDWAEKSFTRCLAGKKVPVEPRRAVACYDATFWISMLVGLRIAQPREQVIDSIVPDQRNALLRGLVGADYDVQKRGDTTRSNMHTVGEFLRCASIKAKPAAAKAR